jgi:hypothetical protein
MLNLIADATSALYMAFCAFALAVQAMTPILPWHAAMAASFVISVLGAVVGWAGRRAIWRLFKKP